MMDPARSQLFWGAIAGLVAANGTAFVLGAGMLSRPGGFAGAFIWAYALLAGLIGVLVGFGWHARHPKWGRRVFMAGAALSLLALGLAYWLFLAFAIYDGPFRVGHLLDGLDKLLEVAPEWAASQFVLALMLLVYWRAGEKLELR